jgi:PIN domain nuclease of toxin-antitoxin system
MTSLLLDTHAAIWLTTDQPLSKGAGDAVRTARAAGETIHVSPISAWEIGLLVARGRINLNARPEVWFDRLMQAPSFALTALMPDVLIAASFLPASDGLRDPADRILVATAREYGHRLVTRDRKILDYASEGHLQAIEC